jgi:hypothetical protein
MDCIFVKDDNCDSDFCYATCSSCGHSVLLPASGRYRRNCKQCLSGNGTAGTQLKKLLEFFFQVPTRSCKCQSRADHMNAMGNDWCEENIDTIVGWLAEEAASRGLPFFSGVGRLLVKRAIHNARKATPH